MESNTKKQKIVIDFGIRKIRKQQFSNTVALPRTALENCADGRFTKFSVKLVQENGEKFLKLTPVFDLEKVIDE